MIEGNKSTSVGIFSRANLTPIASIFFSIYDWVQFNPIRVQNDETKTVKPHKLPNTVSYKGLETPRYLHCTIFAMIYTCTAPN